MQLGQGASCLKIPATYDEARIHLQPHSLKGPYINKLISLTASKLVFDGYFRIEDEMLPIDRVLYLIGRKREYHIRITECKRGVDTSTYAYDRRVFNRMVEDPALSRAIRGSGDRMVEDPALSGAKHGSGDEDVGEHICLTPSEIVELTFRVIATDLPGKALNELILAIDVREESEEFSNKNWSFRDARKEREEAALPPIDYSSWKN
jgi:hypothetical protein